MLQLIRKILYYLILTWFLISYGQAFIFFLKSQLPTLLQNLNFENFNWALFFSALPVNTILVVFVFEMLWLVKNKKSLKASSLAEIFKFKPTHEADLFFWIYHKALMLSAQVGLFTFFIISLMATGVQNSGMSWPLINHQMPLWLSVISFYFLNSFLNFILHLMQHKIPALWQLHKIHHQAEEMTALTVFRDHPLLDITSSLLKGVVLGGLGISIPQAALLITLQNLHVTLLHCKINSRWGWLDKILVSPHRHRIHHSIDSTDQRSNFSTDLILWDKIFKTFRERETVTQIGLSSDDKPRRFILTEILWTTLNSGRAVFKKRV